MAFMKKIFIVFIFIISSINLFSQSPKTEKSSLQITVPVDFVFDPASSYNSNKSVTSVNLPGQFNNWNTGSNPFTYDTTEKIWKTRLNLNTGEYEYKFYLNKSTWTEDPDNPVTRTSYGNSVVTVKSMDTPYFMDFSIPDGTIFPDTISELNLKGTIFLSTDGAPVKTSSISVLYDNSSLNYTFNESTSEISVDISKSKLSAGTHKIIFQCSDNLNKTGKYIFSIGIAGNSGYTYIDESGDSFLPYPNYITEGAADIESFNIKTNTSLDTLIFDIKMNLINDYTRIGLLIYNTITASYTDQIPNIKLQTSDWTNQGIFINLMSPSSKYYDSSKYNYIYTSVTPQLKSKKIIPDSKAVLNNEFVFKIALSDINNLLGEYNSKKYFSLFSYLADSTGADLQVNLPLGSKNQTMVFDIAFARKIRQNILLSNTSTTRIARLDNEKRGIAGIAPEDINPALKSGGPILKILTQSNSEYYSSGIIIEGTINDISIKSVDIYLNNNKFSTVNADNGNFTGYIVLQEGENNIKTVAVNGSSLTGTSNTIKIKYIIDHTPKPQVSISQNNTNISLDASASTDPDNDIDTYSWISDDRINPVKLNINTTGKVLTVTKPAAKGEYYFNLTITDKQKNKSTVRNYFIIDTSSTVKIPDINSNPQWVKDAIVYEVFPKSFSKSGKLSAVTDKIIYLKEMGINVLWLMPIMHNSSEISEMSGGYSIDDFYNIAPEYGTFDEYKTLVDSAHANGIKVILDITPNHVAEKHPWLTDIRTYGKYSIYYNYIEKRILGDNRGNGQSLSSDGTYSHYSNWTLPNLDLSKVETQRYMQKMLKWWLTDMNSDGYRWDVYWGPQNRYGADVFWRPVRKEIKAVKPDVFLLGETDGTGTGSEINYADGGGACDAAYDWNFYTAAKQIFSTSAIAGLHDKATNYGYSPGTNSYFFRFLENHDEDRIGNLVNVEQNKTLFALLMTVPGIPMIYQGQEVGWKDKRNKVDFSNSDGTVLLPFYKRLINTRKNFPAFRTKAMQRITANDGSVYAYTRPYIDQNAIVLMNFSNSSKTVTLSISETSDLILSRPLTENTDYYLNDFSNDTYYKIRKSDLSSLSVTLPGYNARVMILSDKILKIPTGIKPKDNNNIPLKPSLEQNYPNPFNPTTNINYSITKPSRVKIVVYDLMGRELRTLVDEYKTPGVYRISFDSTSFSTGVYLYKLIAGDFSEVKKMIVLR
jgi:cyclomaltodextrinase / maltogenic alpha-amylase / neopullulanase